MPVKLLLSTSPTDPKIRGRKPEGFSMRGCAGSRSSRARKSFLPIMTCLTGAVVGRALHRRHKLLHRSLARDCLRSLFQEFPCYFPLLNRGNLDPNGTSARRRQKQGLEQGFSRALLSPARSPKSLVFIGFFGLAQNEKFSRKWSAGILPAWTAQVSRRRTRTPAVHLAAEPKPLDERASCSRRRK